ncbi:hypothetical protein ACJX0J_041201, partial [Zea mays]
SEWGFIANMIKLSWAMILGPSSDEFIWSINWLEDNLAGGRAVKLVVVGLPAYVNSMQRITLTLAREYTVKRGKGVWLLLILFQYSILFKVRKYDNIFLLHEKVLVVIMTKASMLMKEKQLGPRFYVKATCGAKHSKSLIAISCLTKF